MVIKRAYTLNDSNRHTTSISMLLDDVLLDIFDFYRKNHEHLVLPVWKWHVLVHVCQRWRRIVFASPRRLNIHILCTSRTPVGKSLRIWPAFPIIVHCRYSYNEADVIAALKHPDRVSFLRLAVTHSELEKIATVIQEPFPVLMSLCIESRGSKAPVLPTKFLGGFAPSLRTIVLEDILFPALPTLLLSTSNLVDLHLRNIPWTGYISPEAMVAGLAALPRLKTFIIKFRSASLRPDRIHPHPVTRTVLPALTFFHYQGSSQYLEGLVAQIDSPQLNQIHIKYLDRDVDFPVAQLSKFVDRSVGPKLSLFRHARVSFFSNFISFAMYRHPDRGSSNPARAIISCEWQVSHIVQVFSRFSATLFNVVHLELEAKPLEYLSGIDNVEWFRLLRQLSTVRTLHASSKLAGYVALALEDITGEMITEVLPSLDLICLSGKQASSVGKFVAARQLSDRPVTVTVVTRAEFNKRLESYISK